MPPIGLKQAHYRQAPASSRLIVSQPSLRICRDSTQAKKAIPLDNELVTERELSRSFRRLRDLAQSVRQSAPTVSRSTSRSSGCRARANFSSVAPTVVRTSPTEPASCASSARCSPNSTRDAPKAAVTSAWMSWPRAASPWSTASRKPPAQRWPVVAGGMADCRRRASYARSRRHDRLGRHHSATARVASSSHRRRISGMILTPSVFGGTV